MNVLCAPSQDASHEHGLRLGARTGASGTQHALAGVIPFPFACTLRGGELANRRVHPCVGVLC